jgi:hypothetical protein
MSSAGAFPIAFLLQIQGDQEVKTRMQSVGGAFQNFGKTAETVNKQAEKINPNFQQAALGLTSAATSAVGLAFQFDNLSKAELRVDQAEKNATQARASYLAAQNSLNELTAKGAITGIAYEQASLRLKAAQEQLAIADEKVNQAQGDLAQGQLQFALQVIPTAITSVTAFKGGLTAMGIGFHTANAGSQVASVGVQRFGLATRLAQLAMGPFGIAMLAIGTVFTLVATNAFGIRDALDSFAKKVEEIFPVLKPVFDFFRNIASALFPEARDEADDLTQNFSGNFASMSNAVTVSTNEQAGALTTLGDTFTSFQQTGSSQIDTLVQNVDKAADSIVSDASRIDKALHGAGITIASPAAVSSSGASTTRTIPNPIGAPITVPVTSFGSMDVSQLRASGGVTSITNVITIDGEEVSRQLKKYSVKNFGSMT